MDRAELGRPNPRVPAPPPNMIWFTAGMRSLRSPATAWLLVCGGYAIWALTVGWGRPLLDLYSFRQTQTAITVRAMVGQLPRLAYETPVLGAPWSIPMEFPLYQWIVAVLVTIFGTAIDQTGRLVSILFFLLCLIPCHSLLRSLGVAAEGRLLALCLLLVSPFHLYWARCFLIESTALFLCLSYAALGRAPGGPAGRPRLIGAAVCGVLGACVKVTTLPPFAALLLLCRGSAWLADWKGRKESRVRIRILLEGAVLFVPPLLAASLWTVFTDGVKSENALGRSLTSAALWDWNFGTWSQKLSWQVWGQILERGRLAVGSLFVLVLSGAVVLGTGRRRKEFLACLGLHVLAPAIFTNLHHEHEYYGFANQVFLVAGVAFALEGLGESEGSWRRARLPLFLAVTALMGYRYFEAYHPVQSADSQAGLLRFSRDLGRSTGPEDLLVIIGHDWSPEIPYYAGRRALMIPDWKSVALERWPEYLQGSRGCRIGALVVSASSPHASQRETIRKLRIHAGLSETPLLLDGHHEVYVK